jgi:hypothetical protein
MLKLFLGFAVFARIVRVPYRTVRQGMTSNLHTLHLHMLTRIVRCTGERFLFGFDNWVTILGGLIVFMWDTQVISPQVKMAQRCCKAYTCVDEGAHYTWDMTLSHVIRVQKIKTWLGSTDRLQVWRASQRLWSEGPRVMVKLEQDLAPMEWNVQGKGITYRAFYFTSHKWVEKLMTEFRIDGRTIKRGKLVCILVI